MKRAKIVDIKRLLAVRRNVERLSPRQRGQLVYLLLGAEAEIYRDEFAIVSAPDGQSCAILDLKSKDLHWAAIELRPEQVLRKMTEPGAVQHFRFFIAQHPNHLPFE